MPLEEVRFGAHGSGGVIGLEEKKSGWTSELVVGGRTALTRRDIVSTAAPIKP